MQPRARGAVTIEKGIPMPKPKQRRGELRDTLEKMVVGDSIIIPHDAHVYDIARAIGIRVVSSKIEGGGFRVWRCA